MVNIDGIVDDLRGRWEGEPSRRESEVAGVAIGIISQMSGISLTELFSSLTNRTSTDPAGVVARAALRYLEISGDRFMKTGLMAYANLTHILTEMIAEVSGME